MDSDAPRIRDLALPDDHPLGPGGSVMIERVRELSAADVAALLRDRTRLPQFVIADAGLPPEWVPLAQTFAFWKREVRPRVADPAAAGWVREDFPGEYFYRASE